MNGRSVKLTPLRLAALRYAAGEDDIQPTYAVARPLELAGLIVWTVHRDNRITSDMKRRGWQITARGKALLACEVRTSNYAQSNTLCADVPDFNTREKP
jgi:hypothetical protein